MTPVVTAVETHPVAVAIVPETTPGPVTVVAEEGEDDLGVQFEPETDEGTAADDAAVPAMPAAPVPAPVATARSSSRARLGGGWRSRRSTSIERRFSMSNQTPRRSCLSSRISRVSFPKRSSSSDSAIGELPDALFGDFLAEEVAFDLAAPARFWQPLDFSTSSGERTDVEGEGCALAVHLALVGAATTRAISRRERLHTRKHALSYWSWRGDQFPSLSFCL